MADDPRNKGTMKGLLGMGTEGARPHFGGGRTTVYRRTPSGTVLEYEVLGRAKDGTLTLRTRVPDGYPASNRSFQAHESNFNASRDGPESKPYKK